MVLVNAQSDQVFTFPLRLLPIVPDTVSETVSEPLVDLFEFGMNTCQTVVVHPSHPDLSEFVKPFLKTVRSGFLGYLLELSFE